MILPRTKYKTPKRICFNINEFNINFTYFQELMTEFSSQTKKKVVHGLRITKKFKEWIKNNPTIVETGKTKMLALCDEYEKQLPKIKLANLREIIRQKHPSSECLSTKYINEKTKLLCRCKKGHKFEITPNSIKMGKWCSKCAGNKRLSLEELKEFVRKQHPGGDCLANEYINNSTKVSFRCKEGHEWKTTPKHIRSGHWCPRCAGKGGITLKELKEYVKKMHPGGECLATEYLNDRTKVLVRCKEGHRWEISPNNIRAGRWCPHCAEGVSERITRKLFETIFNKKFPKARPKWLINDRGNQMELDGFNQEFHLAFEYQGRQHYRYLTYFHKSKCDFEQRKAADKLKRELCRKNNVTLIEIPYTIKPEKIQNFIINECKKNKINLPEIKNKINIQDLDVYSSRRLKKLNELKEFVKKQHPGGECLATEYINNRTKVPFRCKERHVWKATPSHVKGGTWCPKCSAKERGKKLRSSLKELKEYVAQHHPGGEILATEYINNYTKVLCRCKELHLWEAAPRHIKRGSWCPECNKGGKRKS